jgi:hypothetical protein
MAPCTKGDVKFKLAISIVLLALPVATYGHSEIIFPKIFSPAELSNTGFAVLNPDSLSSSISFFILSANGANLTTGPPPTFRIPPGGQLTKLGGELFPNVSSGGWVYAVIDTEGAQAFWLNYDSGVTFLDGAEAAQLDTIGPDQIISLVAGQAELNVINPNGIKVPVTIRLFGDAGELAPAFLAELPIAGGLQTPVSAIFPTADMTRARYIRVRTPGAPIGCLVLIRGFLVPAESAVVNGVNVSTQTEVNFPHVINGGLAGSKYTTIISITNVAPFEQPVSITFHNGENPLTIVRTLASNAAFRESVQVLFGLGAEFQSGWVSVRGIAALSGAAVYADTTAGGLAAVPASASQTNFFLMHLADGPPQWQTGLALANPGPMPANVEISAVTASGSLIGRAFLFLDPGKKLANVIHELIPQARGINGGFVYIRSINRVPLSGMELFYTEDQRVLSNVAVGRLVPGVVYSPSIQ